jgi:solute carrier family 25 (adenine nucleotide translocator) protein 4/5/6/31
MNDTFVEAVAGAASGALSKTITAPLDRLKLVVQLRSEITQQPKTTTTSTSTTTTATTTTGLYGGPIRTLRKILHEEGLWALWRGNVPTVLIQGGTSALNFCFMDLYKSAAMDAVGNTEYRLVTSLTSAALGGATAMTVLYPLGLMRTKLALDMGQEGTGRVYPNGMRDVLVRSVSTNGITSLYRGYSVALVSVTIYRMIHLGGYDYVKWVLQEQQQQQQQEQQLKTDLPFGQRLAVAQMVTIVASTVHYPFDSVRRRLMMQADNPVRRYGGSYDCFRQVVTHEGVRGLYHGLGTSYVRSVGGSLLLVSYDFFKGHMASW